MDGVYSGNLEVKDTDLKCLFSALIALFRISYEDDKLGCHVCGQETRLYIHSRVSSIRHPRNWQATYAITFPVIFFFRGQSCVATYVDVIVDVMIDLNIKYSLLSCSGVLLMCYCFHNLPQFLICFVTSADLVMIMLQLNSLRTSSLPGQKQRQECLLTTQATLTGQRSYCKQVKKYWCVGQVLYSNYPHKTNEGSQSQRSGGRGIVCLGNVFGAFFPSILRQSVGKSAYICTHILLVLSN